MLARYRAVLLIPGCARLIVTALVGRVVSPGSETEAFTWAASALIVGLAIGSALAGGAIDVGRGGGWA